jgi:FG-GAP repeat
MLALASWCSCLVLLLTPSTADATQCPTVQLAALNAPGQPRPDIFGRSVALFGDILVVGDPTDADMGPGAGAVFVFRRDERGAGEWQRVAKLYGSPPGAGQEFGLFTEIDGNHLVVGAQHDSTSGVAGSGAVFVFERPGLDSDSWVQVAKLIASDPTQGAAFGTVAAVSGRTIAVGAPWAMPTSKQSGAVYVFEKADVGSGSIWTQVQILSPPLGENFDWFGADVTLDEVTLGVGTFNDDSAALGAGAVYVYERLQGSWMLQSKLTAPDASINDHLHSVALSGTHLIAGANSDDDQAINAGSAYVFERLESGWIFRQKLLPLEGEGGAEFGKIVDADGDLLVITAPNSDVLAPDAGATYEFRRSSLGTWLQTGILGPLDVQPQDSLSWAATSEGVVAIGVARFLLPGTVYLFDSRESRTSTTYCTSTPTSLPDCTPQLQVLGSASATSSSQFSIHSGRCPGYMLGVFFYTHSRVPLPISNSLGSCLPGPAVGRSGALFSNGTPGMCDGQLVLDWNSLLASQAGSDPALTQAGTLIHGQFAYFPLGSTGRVGFTDAVAFITCP